MKNLIPTEFELYKNNYTSAYKQFDKYFLFVERALDLLLEDGLMGYILPLKFMKVTAGLKLRGLLSHNKYVSDITSFGANQVFDSKTTYTCILILNKLQSNDFCYTEVTSLDKWKIRVEPPQKNTIHSNTITSETWLLMKQELEPLYKKISGSSETLEAIIGSPNIINGIQTSANRIYIHEPSNEDTNYYYFRKDGAE